MVTSATAASVVSTWVITWSVSSSQVSVRCTLYPVQVICLYCPKCASGSYGESIRILAGGTSCA